ncbi:ras-related protein Rab-30 isoform X1 [Xyrichtys novacula]|uniref:Ras-related protein Rab-30 n=1 Tax=Xyrichtys novacula TaxID=13765 RepID=A0AAV1FWF6_XYRNO|nr:ras-related protein Rab-30 isoform X1 [Xyrichtys novacula]
MTLERYVAICMPLHHEELCSMRRTMCCIFFIQGLSTVPSLVLLFAIFSSTHINFYFEYRVCTMPKITVHYWQQHVHSAVYQFYFLIMTVIIVFCYVKIMKVAKVVSGDNKESTQKGLRTVILHAFQLLLCLMQLWFPIIEANVHISDIRVLGNMSGCKSGDLPVFLFSMSMEDYDYLFKIVLIGNAGVGKTCLVRRFTQGLFPPGQGATIGVDFMIKTVEIKGEKVKLQIWDTAGQERFRSITQSYYRSANALILTYDITCEDSFRCLPEWLREIEQYANNQVVTILVGNKIDLAEKREVLRQRAEDFAESQSMLYLETSAKESDNVEKLFLDLACELIREAKQNKLDNNDTAPMPGEGKTISYLTCCSVN